MTADFTFYTRFCGGNTKIPSAEYERWESSAELELERMTAGRAVGADGEKIKKCICEMAELMYREAQTDGVTSENNDGYSVTYNTEKSVNDRLCGIIKRYLHGTDFLQRC